MFNYQQNKLKTVNLTTKNELTKVSKTSFRLHFDHLM